MRKRRAPLLTITLWVWLASMPPPASGESTDLLSLKQSAKINDDWLLDAQPLRIWLAARSDLPFVGSLFAEPWVAYAFSWFGAYDLTIVLRRDPLP